jgi:hypothetical protein
MHYSTLPCQRSKYAKGKHDERKDALNGESYLRFLVALGSTVHIIMMWFIRNVEGVGVAIDGLEGCMIAASRVGLCGVVWQECQETDVSAVETHPVVVFCTKLASGVSVSVLMDESSSAKAVGALLAPATANGGLFWLLDKDRGR